MIERDIARLEHRLSGIRNMKRLPDVLFVVDIMREDTAVHEANLKDIPVLAMVDTNCDPKNVDYVIPSNDDAIRAIKLIVGKMADAVMEGKAIRNKDLEDEELQAEAMPVGVSRFIDDDEELEDEELLGASTLKHLGTAKRPKSSELEEEELDAALEVKDQPAEEAEDVDAEAEAESEDLAEETTEEAPVDETAEEDEAADDEDADEETPEDAEED